MDATSRLRARTLFTAVDTMDVAPLDSSSPRSGCVVFGNGQQVTVPCVTIFHTDAAGKIDDYRVHVDVAPIYA